MQVTTVDKAAFAKATSSVDDKWLASPIGAYLKKVIARPPSRRIRELRA